MKGLKIIPMFLMLMVCTYLGMLFVEAHRTEVTIQLGDYQSPPTALGFVVLTSVLVGMVLAGFLCSVELLALYVQNKNLKRRLSRALNQKSGHSGPTNDKPSSESSESLSTRPSGRFT